MNNWLYAADVPAAEFRGSMTLPGRLTLRERGRRPESGAASGDRRAAGEVAIADQVFPSPASTGLAVFADGGIAAGRGLTDHPVVTSDAAAPNASR